MPVFLIFFFGLNSIIQTAKINFLEFYET